MILLCLRAGRIDLLDIMDDNNKSKRMILMYYELMRKGLIEENPDTVVQYKLTDLGNQLLNNIDFLLSEEIKEDIVKEDNKVEDKVDNWIDKWVRMFPSGVKSGGKLLRSDAKSCLIKMKQFLKDYPYDKDTIFKATLNYLADKKEENWQFTRCAIYFISKRGEGSDLAAECEKLINGDHEETLPVGNYSTGLI